MTYFLIVAVVVGTGVSNVLLKLATNHSGAKKICFFISSGFGFISVVVIALYLMKIVCFKDFSIIFALNFLSTNFFSATILNEKIQIKQCLFLLLIIVGIIIFYH